ncbi:MAG: SDR family NAD(P)-dependent oxidoreductase [Alphaproteobacteria bacterium]|nr:SDR family NAD(P)-dependent oxidoreductase [Alphaproteobacteria bacterium]
MTVTQLAAFGCGYVATAFAARLATSGTVTLGTTRTVLSASILARTGIEPVIWSGEGPAPPPAIPGAAWLVSVPPDATGCPVFRALSRDAPHAAWLGYLSTTGVYGDLGGRWAFEETPVRPLSREAANRVTAESQWLSLGAHIFRLPGIYGPGRSALERVREPGARRIVKPGQVFSRAHRDDIVSALALSIARPRPGAVYNVCDDEPAPADAVLSYAAGLLGVADPPALSFEEAGLSPAGQRFYAECKRVSNARAKSALGWRPAYPTYREGLMSCLAATPA